MEKVVLGCTLILSSIIWFCTLILSGFIAGNGSTQFIPANGFSYVIDILSVFSIIIPIVVLAVGVIFVYYGIKKHDL